MDGRLVIAGHRCGAVPAPGLLRRSSTSRLQGRAGDRKEVPPPLGRHRPAGGRPLVCADRATKLLDCGYTEHKCAARASGSPPYLCCQKEPSMMDPRLHKLPLDISPQVLLPV